MTGEFNDPISVVLVGHVDHGKSTFIGRLLYDTGNVTADKMADVERVSRDLGRKTEFAYVTDQFQEEREQNITIDTSQTFLNLDHRPFILIDAPGHKEYLKNMITGASQAKHAIMMLDINEGVREQTDKHAQILKLIGILKPAVMINKMDMVNYDEKTFRKHEEQILALLRERGLSPEAIVPIAAYHGDNIVLRSTKMPWYTGPTALDFLKSRHTEDTDPASGNLQFPVQLVHDVDGQRLIMGRIERGSVTAGQEVVLFPSGRAITVEKVLKFNQNVNSARAGECIALKLRGNDPIKRGDVLCANSEHARPIIQFSTHTFWAAETPVRVGDELVVECRTQSARCTINRMEDLLNDAPLTEMKAGDVAKLDLTVKDRILIGRADAQDALSRVVFHAGGQVAGCGVVTDVLQGAN